ncbi:hypothetical protein, partial [Salmonella enterica]|uniref:hypothetical protein n=1 Tax=Salmonella enterica TaxID=28901 RepID=UPI001C7DA21D
LTAGDDFMDSVHSVMVDTILSDISEGERRLWLGAYVFTKLLRTYYRHIEESSTPVRICHVESELFNTIVCDDFSFS